MVKEEAIKLPARITSIYLLNEFLTDIAKYYRKYGNDQKPTFSFELVKYIDPFALPLFLSISSRISKYHNSPLYLVLKYERDLLSYLKFIRFFDLIGSEKYEFKGVIEEGLNIFNFDKEILYNIEWYGKSYHEIHQVKLIPPILNFYQIEDEIEQENYRCKVFQLLRYGTTDDDDIITKLTNTFLDERIMLLHKTGYLSEIQINKCLNAYAEILCNSILYSLSNTFIIWSSTKYKTSIAVTDNGIGFQGSFSYKKKYEFPMSKIFTNISEKNEERFNDFRMIIEVLNYSMNKKRKNLWSLKDEVVNNNGVLRIHYNTTQVVFTANRCHSCKKEAVDCGYCLLENYRVEPEISPLRIFSACFPGVHLEVEFKKF